MLMAYRDEEDLADVLWWGRISRPAIWKRAMDAREKTTIGGKLFLWSRHCSRRWGRGLIAFSSIPMAIFMAEPSWEETNENLHYQSRERSSRLIDEIHTRLSQGIGRNIRQLLFPNAFGNFPLIWDRIYLPVSFCRSKVDPKLHHEFIADAGWRFNHDLILLFSDIIETV